MIVNTTDITKQGSLGGRKIAMTLDTDSLPHLMSVLSNLYSDPAGAVVREYTTNAMDSHKAAGQTRPVELTRPNRLSPFFVVQDFGVGMSEADIENIYSQFGNSTKRQSNTESGMLGLGSKSALTFTQQFNLIAVKDGRKVIASIGRSEDGTGGIEIVATSDTTEGNGVTIKIPVQSNHDYFNEKIDQFSKYVRDGSLMINGKLVESDLDFITPEIAVRPDRGYNVRDRVVMGDVSYPTNEQAMYGQQVIYFVPMGSVDFTPSREELHFTARTDETLERVSDEFTKAFSAHLRDKLNAAETYRDAHNLNIEMDREYPSQFWNLHNSRWNGLGLGSYTYVMGGGWNSSYLEDCKIRYEKDSRISTVDSTVPIITEWTNSRLNRNQATKIFKYFEALGETVDKVIFTTDMESLHPGLFRDNPTASWEDIKKIKLTARVRNKVDRGAATWEGYNGTQNYETWLTPSMTKTVYYGAKSRYNDGTGRMIANSGAEFYFVADSQVDRFKNKYAHAQPASAYYGNFVTNYLTNLTEEDMLFYKYGQRYTNFTVKLDHNEIDDPVLAEMMQQAYADHSVASRRYDEAISAFRKVNYSIRDNYVFPKFERDDGEHINNYPLLVEGNWHRWRLSDETSKHLVQYVNMVYAQNTNTTKKEENNDSV